MICTVKNRPYRVFGYKGKQVRDNIHSFDLVEAFVEFIHAPRVGEVYNIGGSRHSNCSMLEAIDLYEKISGYRLTWSYEETNRIGDHIWWISVLGNFSNTILAGNFGIVCEKLSKKSTAQSLTARNNCSPNPPGWRRSATKSSERDRSCTAESVQLQTLVQKPSGEQINI